MPGEEAEPQRKRKRAAQDDDDEFEGASAIMAEVRKLAEEVRKLKEGMVGLEENVAKTRVLSARSHLWVAAELYGRDAEYEMARPTYTEERGVQASFEAEAGLEIAVEGPEKKRRKKKKDSKSDVDNPDEEPLNPMEIQNLREDQG